MEVDGPEVPVLDGSAAPFVILLHEAGLRPLAVPRLHVKVKEPVEVVHGTKSARLRPAEHFEIGYSIGFDHPLLRHQALSLRVTPRSFTERSPPRARSASCARWRCSARAASPSGAASRTRS